MKRVYIIQPAVPKYRVALFDKLSALYDLKIFTTKKDFLGVETKVDNNYVKTSEGFSSFFNNRLFWQKKLPLFSPFQKGDCVIINGNPRILNYMLLILICRLRNIDTIWWGHGWSAGSYGISSRIRIQMMRLASKIAVYTDKEKERLGFFKNKIHGLNNGLDSESINKAIVSAGNIEKPVDTLRMIFLGRLTEKSGLDALFSALTDVDRNVELLIIGNGPRKQYLTELAESLGVQNKLSWLGAIYDENEIAKIMLSSHVFVYPGSVGLSLIHAFNYRLPAILHSSEEYHMPEFAAFEDGVNGFGFQKNNSKSLAETINKFIQLSPSEYETLSSNAKKTVKETYNVDDMASRLAKLIG
nr:glycosyltransferase family 4 protein [uncultured Vibrio sp.]